MWVRLFCDDGFVSDTVALIERLEFFLSFLYIFFQGAGYRGTGLGDVTVGVFSRTNFAGAAGAAWVGGRRHVPGAEGDDLCFGAIVVDRHLADHDGAGFEVFGAFPPAKRGELLRVEVAVREAVGVDWIERRGPDQDGRHGLEIGFAC